LGREGEQFIMAKSHCNVTALRKASRRLSQIYDAALAPHGLRSTQRAILAHVARAKSPTMGELATALVLDRTALNHNLKPLIRDGYLKVAVDENDARGRRIELTDRGQQILEASHDDWLAAQQRFERMFGETQAAALRSALETIAAMGLHKR
jgi:DNA-binding MarR family transcriptional regulator